MTMVRAIPRNRRQPGHAAVTIIRQEVFMGQLRTGNKRRQRALLVKQAVTKVVETAPVATPKAKAKPAAKAN
jgi:hypothetical protein